MEEAEGILGSVLLLGASGALGAWLASRVSRTRTFVKQDLTLCFSLAFAAASASLIAGWELAGGQCWEMEGFPGVCSLSVLSASVCFVYGGRAWRHVTAEDGGQPIRALVDVIMFFSVILAFLTDEGGFFVLLRSLGLMAEAVGEIQVTLEILRASLGPSYAWAVVASLGFRVIRLLFVDFTSLFLLFSHRAVMAAYVGLPVLLCIHLAIAVHACNSIMSLAAGVEQLEARSLGSRKQIRD